MAMNTLRKSMDSVWDSVSEGWDRLRQSAVGALTRFRPSEKSAPPSGTEIVDPSYMPSARWAMMGGDVFEDADRLVVRIEAPGMEKDDFAIEVADGMLVVSGEKRFERETTEGRWRVMQCAYGRFRRVVPLPQSVTVESARASYRRGVLRIELPKARGGERTMRQIRVD